MHFNQSHCPIAGKHNKEIERSDNNAGPRIWIFKTDRDMSSVKRFSPIIRKPWSLDWARASNQYA